MFQHHHSNSSVCFQLKNQIFSGISCVFLLSVPLVWPLGTTGKSLALPFLPPIRCVLSRDSTWLLVTFIVPSPRGHTTARGHRHRIAQYLSSLGLAVELCWARRRLDAPCYVARSIPLCAPWLICMSQAVNFHSCAYVEQDNTSG